MTTTPTHALIKFPIQSEAGLYAYIQHTYGVKIPRVKVCEHHQSPWQAFSDAYFARGKAPIYIWKASRGFGGKSFLESLFGAVCAHTLAAEVKILGGSGAQSRRVLSHMADLWGRDNAPSDQITSDTTTIQKLANGGSVEALLASQKSARGPHPQVLMLDEVDEMDLAILDAAMGQTMGAERYYGYVAKRTVMASTQQYADGTMAEMYTRARKNGWNCYEWCYRESMKPHGWLEPSEVDSKKLEVVEAMWAAEYEGQEPAPTDRAIDPDLVNKMFTKELGFQDGEYDSLVNYREWEPPIAGASYATGADWARKQDFTEIVTIRTDCTPKRVVAYERMRRMPWPVMIDRFKFRTSRYKGSNVHDGTGMGDVIDHFLTEYQDVQDLNREEYKMLQQMAEPFLMIGQARHGLFSEYIKAIETGEIIAPHIKPLYLQHLYCSVDDLFRVSSVGTHHPPDGLVACALAWRGYLHPRNLVGFA